MGADDVFPAEMPDPLSHPPGPTVVPLDDDTAERLLAGRRQPEDAPPGYAEVAGLLRAAAGPASPDELAGQEAALAAFRVARSGPGQGRARPDLTTARLRRHQVPFRLRRDPIAVGGGAGAPRRGPGWSRSRWSGRWSPVGRGWGVGCGQPVEPSPPLGYAPPPGGPARERPVDRGRCGRSRPR